MFSEVRPVRSFEDVVSQIQEAISSGELKAGERLASERELCVTFGVGRTTLREALRWLEALGQVEVKLGGQGGVFVTEPTPGRAGTAIEALIRFHQATAKDLEEFRASFEAETAFWAAQRATEADLEGLQRIVGEITSGASDAHVAWETISELDLQFHQAVAKASGNRVREAVMLGVHQAVRRASLSLDRYMSQTVRESIARDLDGVLQAIRGGEKAAARRRMRQHVVRFSRMERDVLEGSATDESAEDQVQGAASEST